MTQAKHTPGPWTISATCREYNNELMILAMEAGDNGVHICQVTTNGKGKNRSVTPEQDATAALIAAAPDLLNVAQHALWLIERDFEISPAGLDDLRAAITKATGGAA